MSYCRQEGVLLSLYKNMGYHKTFQISEIPIFTNNNYTITKKLFFTRKDTFYSHQNTMEGEGAINYARFEVKPKLIRVRRFSYPTKSNNKYLFDIEKDLMIKKNTGNLLPTMHRSLLKNEMNRQKLTMIVKNVENIHRSKVETFMNNKTSSIRFEDYNYKFRASVFKKKTKQKLNKTFENQVIKNLKEFEEEKENFYVFKSILRKAHEILEKYGEEIVNQIENVVEEFHSLKYKSINNYL